MDCDYNTSITLIEKCHAALENAGIRFDNGDGLIGLVQNLGENLPTSVYNNISRQPDLKRKNELTLEFLEKIIMDYLGGPNSVDWGLLKRSECNFLAEDPLDSTYRLNGVYGPREISGSNVTDFIINRLPFLNPYGSGPHPNPDRRVISSPSSRPEPIDLTGYFPSDDGNNVSGRQLFTFGDAANNNAVDGGVGQYLDNSGYPDSPRPSSPTYSPARPQLRQGAYLS